MRYIFGGRIMWGGGGTVCNITRSSVADFPGGSATLLFQSVRRTLFALADSTRIFVGHDYMPAGRRLVFETTVAEEKKANTHLNVDITESDFVQMRTSRDNTLGNPKLLFPSLLVG